MHLVRYILFSAQLKQCDPYNYQKCLCVSLRSFFLTLQAYGYHFFFFESVNQSPTVALQNGRQSGFNVLCVNLRLILFDQKVLH